MMEYWREKERVQKNAGSVRVHQVVPTRTRPTPSLQLRPVIHQKSLEERKKARSPSLGSSVVAKTLNVFGPRVSNLSLSILNEVVSEAYRIDCLLVPWKI